MNDTPVNKPVVLVVDDEKNTRKGIGRALRRDYDVMLRNPRRRRSRRSTSGPPT